MNGREIYDRLFGPPALQKTVPAPDAERASSRAEQRAERYREHLRERFGSGVPDEVVEAFETAYALGFDRPDQIEALITGLRAGVHDRQRARCGGWAR